MRTTPPWPSETRISSPGATRKRSISRSPSPQTPLTVKQALPGRLEKEEIRFIGSTEPTMIRLSVVPTVLQSMLKFWV